MDTTPNIAPTAPEKPAAEATPKACPKKKGCGAIILLLVLLVLAGAGASVFLFLENQNQSKEISRLKENTVVKKEETASLSKEEVKTILDPFVTGDNMYFYYEPWEGLTEDEKVSFVFQNLPLSATYAEKEGALYVQYYQANILYKRLFGSNENLPKTDRIGVKYEAKNDRFLVYTGGKGGTAHYVVNKIKDYSLDGDTLEVELYHDILTFCGASSVDYYCDYDKNIGIGNSSEAWLPDFTDDEEADAFVEKYEEQIPIFKFTFKKSSNDYDDIEKGDLSRFVLVNIEKQ